MQFGIVLRHSLSVVIRESEVDLSARISLVGGFAVPACSLDVVLRQALAVVIHVAKTVLTLRIALVGSFAIPACSLVVVLRHAPAVLIHVVECELRRRVAVLRVYMGCLRVFDQPMIGLRPVSLPDD